MMNNEVTKSFKIGDWVSYEDSNYIILSHDKYLENPVAISCYYANHNRFITRWKPKKGELCIFWNNSHKAYHVARYGSKISECNNVYASEKKWDNIAPLEFIQMLKK